MFRSEFLKSLKNFVLFLILYTAVFILVYSTIPLTFPFLVAFAIAFLIQPVTRFFRNRLKLRKNIPALLASLSVYIFLSAVLFIFFYSIILEARQLLVNLSSLNPDALIKPVRSLLNEIGLFFQNIDPTFIEKNSSQFAELLKDSMDIMGRSLSAFLSIALSIPMWITILFIVILSTYFFSRDMTMIKQRIFSVFSESGRKKFEDVWYQGIRMMSQYVKSYCFIYFLTFLETLAGFLLLGIRYTVILSIICAVADILPILGIGLVYLPLALVCLLSGNYFTAVGVLSLFLFIVIVRQIIEPRIVSNSLGIHPVLSLVIIFIGLKAYGLAGMVYLTFLVVFYKVLRNSKLL